MKDRRPNTILGKILDQIEGGDRRRERELPNAASRDESRSPRGGRAASRHRSRSPAGGSSSRATRSSNGPSMAQNVQIRSSDELPRVITPLSEITNKSAVALGYPAFIGEEEWCLKCHEVGKTNETCPGGHNHGTIPKLLEDHKLVERIPVRYLLDTHRTIPTTLRGLVKEILIHVLDTDQFIKHVRERDAFFAELIEKMPYKQLFGVKDEWERFMASINQSVDIYARGNAFRTIDVLGNVVRKSHPMGAESLSDFVTLVFRRDVYTDPVVSVELVKKVHDDLAEWQGKFTTWLSEWSHCMHRFVTESPKLTRFFGPGKPWFNEVFFVLERAQLYFEKRNSIWIPHLCYPDLKAIGRALDELG